MDRLVLSGGKIKDIFYPFSFRPLSNVVLSLLIIYVWERSRIQICLQAGEGKHYQKASRHSTYTTQPSCIHIYKYQKSTLRGSLNFKIIVVV